VRHALLLAAAAAVLAGSGSASAARPPTVWLCAPGIPPNPCGKPLDTTVVRGDGTRTVEHVRAAKHPPIDCFYVYPTVSLQQTGNADRSIHVWESLIAVNQASQFSQVCRVFAPIYRQITDAGLRGQGNPNPYMPYYDVLDAWNLYLRRWNHGRGVVLIGHSQGAQTLDYLVKMQIDGVPAQRRRVVSAILLGTNIRYGRYAHVPPCGSATQTGCLVAYSSFDRRPQANARFGIAQPGEPRVVCVNPGGPGGGPRPVTPLFPSELIAVYGGRLSFRPKTPWVSFPGLYTATCKRTAKTTWLQVDHKRRAGDKRPLVRADSNATGGLHRADVNIALASLIQLVRSQSAAYERTH
jgi:pimeloyl-ACP methyl ester carboxylesterase